MTDFRDTFGRPMPKLRHWRDEVPEATPSFTLDREIERAKREMGPKRWAELNALWESGE